MDVESILDGGAPPDHGGKLRDAAHLSLQSLGRAVNATDAILQDALYSKRLHGDGGEYAHLSEKALGSSHTAMKYLTLGASIGDTAVESDGHFFQNLFKNPNSLPDLVMPMLHGRHDDHHAF